ncbi:MAG: chlorophyllase, partial [Acetivibrio sp.]
QEFGSYTVESLQYSPEYKEDREGEIPSDTVDLSFFTVEEKGLDQRYRKIFQTFDLKTAPIAGKIWYPKEKFNCPVLFIAHGNHSILSASYLGYDYLGEYLASNGYVVVSVDENVLNMRQGENDARAVLLLENIKKVKAFQGDTENPLYKKMDYEKIAIAGHSRGGEMTAVAYLFNSYDCYPENGMKRFNYHFNIQSIIAIAPTVDQYMPTEQEVMLEDVNYLLLHGANDQDVSTFMGNTQYENINFSGKKEAIKSSLYIAGANHGQFNSEWGQYDQINPVAPWLNVDNFISEREQQNILKLFVRVFLDKTLQNKEDYGDLLTHYEKYQKNLPKTIYIQRSQTEDFTCLADFEEDSNLETATWKEASIRGYGMQHWKEEQVHKNQILTLDWKNTKGARLEISLKGIDLKDKSLQFDICDKREYEEEESPKAIDAKVVLLDENGNKASLRIKEHQMVYPSLPVKLSKLEYLFREKEYKSQYQTVMLPTTAFRKEGNHFDFCKVKKLSIYFDTMEKGKISMDNIGFTN